MQAMYISKAHVDDMLATTTAQGKRNLEPFKTLAKETGLPLQFLEDTDVVNDAEIHKKADDLWLCLTGEVTFVCGVKMQDTWIGQNADGTENPDEIKAKTIVGGETYVLSSGDWLWIPAGVPHQHSDSGTARLAIIKIPRV